MFLLSLLIAVSTPDALYAQLRTAADLHAFVQSMRAEKLGRSAEALLGKIAQDPQRPQEVRQAALDELARRAEKDPATQTLLARVDSAPFGGLPSALAVDLAREHLRMALELSPQEESENFSPLQTGAHETQAAEIVPQPLDPELANEMGAQPAAQPPTQPPQAAIDEPGAQANALHELDIARALAGSVPAGDPSEAAAHQVAGLAALAAHDDKAAATELVAVVQLPVKRGDREGAERRDQAYLQLARIAYAANDDARATALYEQVSRNAPEWLDALFEASWSRFRKTDDELALGNLLTLTAPFFRTRFFPESLVLKALVFYENCRYADAKAALQQFDKEWRPLHDGLAQTLHTLDGPERASELLAGGALKLNDLPQGARDELARIEKELAPQVTAAGELAHEVDSLDKKPWHGSALVIDLAPAAREARSALLVSAGRGLLARIDSERAQLRELFGQALRIDYEIAGREKELLASGESDATMVHNERPRVQDDEEAWPFDGEYWRDELGTYRYQLGRRCRKARPAIQTASDAPKDSAARVAADPH